MNKYEEMIDSLLEGFFSKKSKFDISSEEYNKILSIIKKQIEDLCAKYNSSKKDKMKKEIRDFAYENDNEDEFKNEIKNGVNLKFKFAGFNKKNPESITFYRDYGEQDIFFALEKTMSEFCANLNNNKELTKFIKGSIKISDDTGDIYFDLDIDKCKDYLNR